MKIDFAAPNKRYTRAFERYALELSRLMTIQDVAKHLQVSWDTIKDIQSTSLQRRFGKPKLKTLGYQPYLVSYHTACSERTSARRGWFDWFDWFDWSD